MRRLPLERQCVEGPLPAVPVRQWVLSLPYDLRYLLAWNMPLRSAVLTAFLRAVNRHYVAQAERLGVKAPKTGALSVVQRFSSSLQLNVHFHVLYADGVWSEQDGDVTFHPAPPLATITVQEVVLDAVHRIARQLKRFGYADPDDGGKPDADDPALSGLLRAAIQGRQLTGVEAGREPGKVRGGLTVPRPNGKNCSDYAGFSLHANTRVGELARVELERLCNPHSRRAAGTTRSLCSPGPSC